MRVALSNVLTESSYTDDTIKLKSLVSYYLSTEGILLKF